MNWSVAEARASLSRLVDQAGREPQVIRNRGKAVAVVVGVAQYAAFEQWRREHPPKTLADAVDEIREICAAEGYDLEVPPRTARPNAFAEALDGLDR